MIHLGWIRRQGNWIKVSKSKGMELCNPIMCAEMSDFSVIVSWAVGLPMRAEKKVEVRLQHEILWNWCFLSKAREACRGLLVAILCNCICSFVMTEGNMKTFLEMGED